jgi:hypothetical protein
VIRFVGQHAACHAGTGAERWTAGRRVVPTMPASSRHRAPLFVEIDSLAPRGEAKAP